MITTLDEYEAGGLDQLVGLAHQINLSAHEKGFYDTARSFPEAVALIHSEVSEALEEDRAGRIFNWFKRADGAHLMEGEVFIDPETGLVYDRPSSVVRKLPLKPEGRDIELVDALIRILDTLAENGANIDHLIRIKMAYNASRPVRHGKLY